MSTVGSKIKEFRKSKNFKLDEISGHLNISKEILIKIENDKIIQDSNLVFYIGHIRSYSDFLGLDSVEVIKDFKNQIRFKKNDILKEIPKPKLEYYIFGKVKFLSLSLTFTMFTIFFLLFIQNNDRTREYALIPDLPERYNPILEQSTITNTINKDIIKEKIINFTNVNASSNIDIKNTLNIVTLKALNPTWIQLRDSSENIILSKLMEKNEEFSYDIKLRYNITAGNAGNILVLIDNSTMGKIGKNGEVIDSYVIDIEHKN